MLYMTYILKIYKFLRRQQILINIKNMSARLRKFLTKIHKIKYS